MLLSLRHSSNRISRSPCTRQPKQTFLFQNTLNQLSFSPVRLKLEYVHFDLMSNVQCDHITHRFPRIALPSDQNRKTVRQCVQRLNVKLLSAKAANAFNASFYPLIFHTQEQHRTRSARVDLSPAVG